MNSCDIADGMLLSGFNTGGELTYLNQQSGPRKTTFVGAAYTVEFAPKSDPRPAVSTHYIDGVPKDAILVLGTSKECQLFSSPWTSVQQSLYGGMMSTRAKLRGAQATVVLGLVRDLAEHESLDYPVFSFGLGSCAANQTAKVVAVNEELVVSHSGLVVRPGDIMYADVNGVVAVPAEKHDDVVYRTKQRMLANEMTTKDLYEGVDLQTAQKQRRKEFM